MASPPSRAPYSERVRGYSSALLEGWGTATCETLGRGASLPSAQWLGAADVRRSKYCAVGSTQGRMQPHPARCTWIPWGWPPFWTISSQRWSPNSQSAPGSLWPCPRPLEGAAKAAVEPHLQSERGILGLIVDGQLKAPARESLHADALRVLLSLCFT